MRNDFNRLDFRIAKNKNTRKFYVRLNRKWYEVTKDVFSVYYNSYKRIYRANANGKSPLLFEDIDLAYPFMQNTSVDNPVDTFMKNELLLKVHIIKKNLSNEEKTILQEIYFNGKSEREVAHILGLPNTTLHNKKIRLLKKIREILEQN